MDVAVTIRRATPEDLPDITRIYNEAILHTTATFDLHPKTLEDREAWLHSHAEPYAVLVAVMDRRIAGWGSLSEYGSRPAYRFSTEDSVYIDCDYRSRGVGKKMLDELMAVAVRSGFHAVIAQVVAGNEASVRLHQRAGFELVGTIREVGRKFDRWLDILVYEKLLQ